MGKKNKKKKSSSSSSSEGSKTVPMDPISPAENKVRAVKTSRNTGRVKTQCTCRI